jgi:hypothetical protein
MSSRTATDLVDVDPADSLAVLVSEQWLDEFCEHVGSLCAVLQAVARGGSHELISEALENCAQLQDLLNVIPVWAGPVSHPSVNRSSVLPDRSECPRTDAPFSPSWALGDCFPELAIDDELTLPSVDRSRLEESYGSNAEEMLARLQRFRWRADGDLRQLELLSIGHDWMRLSRLAGALKDAAARVSAYRIVVDAAALQGAARVGCRNDVELALEALRSDLTECAREVDRWLEKRPTVEA